MDESQSCIMTTMGLAVVLEVDLPTRVGGYGRHRVNDLARIRSKIPGKGFIGLSLSFVITSSSYWTRIMAINSVIICDDETHWLKANNLLTDR